jgi:peptide chain release factor subunit 3
MIEGAAQADIGILVISARKGEFETGFERDGQTREHVLLAKTAGVKHIILAINKMDEPTVKWDQERYDSIIAKMAPFLKASGYGKNDIDHIPISGFTGANMKDPVDASVCPWYSGPSLLQLLDQIPLDRKYSGPFLMPIADKLKVFIRLFSGYGYSCTRKN